MDQGLIKIEERYKHGTYRKESKELEEIYKDEVSARQNSKVWDPTP